MAAKVNFKRLRAEQLYALGVNISLIAPQFQISTQAVSKLLNLKANPELRRQHKVCRNLDKELRAEKNRPRMQERVRELYALGLHIELVVDQLKFPQQVVTEMTEGDAEIERRHAASVALDRKLIAREPVTEDDFLSVNQVDTRLDGRGEPATNGAPAAEGEDPRNATKEQPEVQPAPDGRRLAAAGDDRGDAAESQPATPRLTAENQPAPPPPDSAKSQPPPGVAEKQPAPKSQPAQIPTKSQPPPESEAAAERAEPIVRRVIELVSDAYRPNQQNRSTPFTEKRTWVYTVPPERQVAMFIASRVTDLSYVQLGKIFGCPSSTVRLAVSEIIPIFCVVHTLCEGMLGIEAKIRHEFSIPWIRSE